MQKEREYFRRFLTVVKDKAHRQVKFSLGVSMTAAIGRRKTFLESPLQGTGAMTQSRANGYESLSKRAFLSFALAGSVSFSPVCGSTSRIKLGSPLVWLCLRCCKHISYRVYAAWYWSWWFPLKASLAAAVAKKCIKRGNSERVVGTEFGAWQTGLFVSRGWGKRLEALSRPFPPLPKMVIHGHWRCISYWQRELRAKA